MTYHEDIYNYLNSHVQNIESIDSIDNLPKKVIGHLDRTVQILKIIDGRQPENYKQLIEYLNQEGRNFGWSYPENAEEEKSETEFWKLKDSIKLIIQSMTANERLYFFGYLAEYENLKSIERSAREDIELKLFMK